MYFLVFAFFTANILIWGSALIDIMLFYRNPKLSPEVNKYCIAQYMAIIGYHHSRVINEYNKKFLPDSEKKEKTLQYQDFLKNIREKRVHTLSFVDIQKETYPNGGGELGELRQRLQVVEPFVQKDTI
jgi:sulfur carrier protein ThiS